MDGVICLSSLLNVSEPSVNVCLTGEGVVTHKPGSTASDDVDPFIFKYLVNKYPDPFPC